MSKPPRVSVVMSAYNSQAYLESAVKSVLEQTFTDFEFIIINDGSTDNTLKILKSFDDPRIRIISRENHGLTYSLNEGISLAQGEYIARQDDDDLSVPHRFETEVKYLDAHPDVALVGSNYTAISTKNEPQFTTRVFTHPDDLKLIEPLSNQFGHGSIMMRKSVLAKVGPVPYDSSVGIVEDYDLFTRISKVAKIANISEPLYLWRLNPNGISLSNAAQQVELAHRVRDREFDYFSTNRKQFKLFTSFHPLSFKPNALIYLDKKSAVFRNLAWLYWHNKNDKTNAIMMIVVAILIAPWRKRNLRGLHRLLTHKTMPDGWEFESI